MSGTMDILIREMTMEDYGQVYDLWTEIKGFGIRSLDDSKEGVERFLKRNPATSVVAVQNGHVVGNILCGHDGRTGCFYHVCVAPGYSCLLYTSPSPRDRSVSRMPSSA